jgi:tetratricopeptide (TPR) repeat protein
LGEDIRAPISAAMNREELVSALDQRIRDFEKSGDANLVLGESASSYARQLAELVASASTTSASTTSASTTSASTTSASTTSASTTAGSNVDVEANVVLGWLHYCRFYVLPETASQADWNAALRYFSAIAQVAPDSIPGSIRWYVTSAGKVTSPAAATDQAIDLMGEFQRTGNLEAINNAVVLFGVAEQATPAADPNRVTMLSNLGIALWTRFERTGQDSDLDAAITAAQQLADSVPAGHPDRDGSLANLAMALWTRFERTRRDSDLDAAVAARQRAADATSAGHPARAGRLSDLGLALRVRFERAGREDDLDAAVAVGQLAVDAASADDVGRPAYLTNLGAALQARYGRTGRSGDLDTAITASRQALDAAPADHPGRPTMLSNLGNALGIRFEQTGQDDDLEAAITALQQAVNATPPDDPARPSFLSNLGLTLGRRFERTGRDADLDAAITALQQAVEAIPAGHPDRAPVLSNLGTLVRRRFERKGLPQDLDIAITALQQVVDGTRPDNPARPSYLSNLGAVLQQRAERTGRADDLDAAIAVCRQAVEATPVGHLARTDRLSNLSLALTRRFERTARADDLESAITAGQMAVDACPAGHPARGMYLSNLGTTLFMWYERAGQAAYLEAAIAAYRQAVNATKADHPARAEYLNNLGSALSRRFERSGREREDLDAAIAAFQQGLQAVPSDHPARVMYLCNAALALAKRFERAGRVTGDLDAAITMLQQAVAASPADDIKRAVPLLGLGHTLLMRFQQAGRMAGDLDAAISALQEAVAASPADHPARAPRLSELGNALRSRFEHTGQDGDLSAAVQCWRAAAESDTAAPAVRIAAARAWGRGEFDEGDWPSAADAYAGGVQLLPQVAWHGLDRATQEDQLAAWAGLAADAAACAIVAGRLRSAVEMLEQGRSVLWTQALSLRSDLTRLREKAPDLAERLNEVRRELNRPSLDDRPAVFVDPPAGEGHIAPRRVTADRRNLARHWDTLIAQVRKLAGFERFLMPVQFADLQAAAAEGPIVIVNTSPLGCHALVVTSTGDPGVTAVALPGLSHEETVDQANTLLSLQRRANDIGRPFLEREADRHAVFDVLEWLWRTIAAPVLDALGHTGAMAEGSPPPRVWWCPTGPLTVLPLHAAGCYPRTASAPARPEDTVPGRVVSSYTPTLTALRRARAASSAHPGEMRQLVVGMPTTSGLNPLPAVADEIHVLADYFRPPQQACHLVAEQATRAAVLGKLPEYPWVHLACHAFQDQIQPAASAFALWDGPMTIADLSVLRLDRPELAFLSACQTAEGATRLLDEAVHLAAAMQMLGYRHVIATMWTIADAPSPDIAKNVYTQLTITGQAETGQTARALHRAVNALYESHPASPLLWAPYVHIGP